MKTAFLVFTACFGLMTSSAISADEVFGPPNLLKAGSTPFNSSADAQVKKDTSALTLDSPPGAGRTSLLSRRLVPCRVYLPGRVVIGKPAEFVVKGRPGQQAAIAMADKNTGAKALYGKDIRLGSDRKLMTFGTIPDTGVLSLFVDIPIQGDLIGQHLYFETAVWSRPDFSDLEIAAPVKSEIGDADPEHVNGVIVTAEADQKRGIRFVPESGVPLHQRGKAGTTSLDSGRP
ncbi:MAG: hypothetical protein K2W95_00130 [Candidatus Obscuribacterales bacterium]|nr:hypothetical protein [Candidatus Obscuribacterales bacterium]